MLVMSQHGIEVVGGLLRGPFQVQFSYFVFSDFLADREV